MLPLQVARKVAAARSPIVSGDKKSFESSTLIANTFQCPVTGK